MRLIGERVIGFLQNSSIFAMSISIIMKLLFFLNVINLINISCFNSLLGGLLVSRTYP